MKLPHGSLIRKLVFENGLNTVLISNPDFRNACLSLSVAAGSCDEPIEYPGLAHLLEHCIFHAKSPGTDKEDLRDFIVMHSGSTNAYTSYDKTTYFFKIAPEQFSKTTDRFLNHLKDPYFCKAGLEKGIKEVDSEHKHHLDNNENKVHDLLIQFLKEGSIDKRFQCGNSVSLQKPNTFDEMVKFFESNYSSDRMNLVISGRESLDQLTMEAAKFSKLSKKDKRRKRVNEVKENFEDAFKPEYYQKIIEYEQKKPDNIMHLFINLVGIDEEVPPDCLNFFQFILNDRDKNSLTAKLRKEQLAFSVSCNFLPGNDFFLSKINFSLTDKGMANYKEVLKVFQDYLNNLSTNKDCYNRYKAVLMHKLNLAECLNQLSLTYKMSYLLHYHNVNSIIKNTFKLGGFKKSDIQNLIKKHLLTSKWIIFVGKRVPIFSFTENYTQIRYNVLEWQNKHKESTFFNIVKFLYAKVIRKFDSKETLNEKKESIDMRKVESLILDIPFVRTSEPSLINKELDYGEIRHFTDNKIYERKCDIYIHFITNNIHSKINLDVYIQSKVDLFIEEFDLLLKTNGVTLSIVNTDIGTAIKFTGLDMTIIDTIKEFASFFRSPVPMNVGLVAEYRRKILIDLHNNPYKYAEKTLSNCILNDSTIDMELEFLSTKYIKDTTLTPENYYLKILAFGAINHDVLSDIYYAFEPTLERPKNPNLFAKDQITLTDEFSDNNWVARYYLVDQSNQSSDRNTYQINYKNRAVGKVLQSISEALFFNCFRTRQQSGYLVMCNDVVMPFGSLISFFIQSKASVTQIKENMDSFLLDLKRYVQNLTESEFHDIRDGAISALEEQPFASSDISKELFLLSTQDIYDIDYKNKLANALRELTKNDLITHRIFDFCFNIDSISITAK